MELNTIKYYIEEGYFPLSVYQENKQQDYKYFGYIIDVQTILGIKFKDDDEVFNIKSTFNLSDGEKNDTLYILDKDIIINNKKVNSIFESQLADSNDLILTNETILIYQDYFNDYTLHIDTDMLKSNLDRLDKENPICLNELKNKVIIFSLDKFNKIENDFYIKKFNIFEIKTLDV